MMKQWKRVLLSLTISVGLLSSAVPAMAAPQDTAVKIDNQAVQYNTGAPILEKGTTFVPLRTTLDALDAELTSTTDDSITAIVNGKTITLKSKLVRINGLTYAPIRIVGDAAGYEVRWDQATRTVLLVSKGGATESVQVGGRGFMWEVQNNGNTVYLVGSMHIADESFYPLRSEFEEAFAEADYLGVEVDVSKAGDEEQQKLVFDLGSYQDGTTLKDHISSETYDKLGEVLKKSGLEPNVLDAYKPWVVENMLAVLKSSTAGYKSGSGVDLYFVQKAAEKNIPLIELESYESQLSMFNSFSKELQEKTLRTTIDNFDVLDQSAIQMAEMWKSGNDEQLHEFTNNFSDDAEYNKAMLFDRNIGMADKIDGYLKNGKGEEYFIVIGAAHYLGDHGIVKLLEEKGYKVERK